MGKKSDKEKKKPGKENKKNAKKGKKESKKAVEPNPQQRIDMIAEAAYYIAEKHGFDPRRVSQDWQQAEQQIDEMIKSK